jgi:hypothetical protein
MPAPLGPEPKDRPNWPNLNAGQRRYAYTQWNRARANRQLPPIPYNVPPAAAPPPAIPSTSRAAANANIPSPPSPVNSLFSLLDNVDPDMFDDDPDLENMLLGLADDGDTNSGVQQGNEDIPSGLSVPANLYGTSMPAIDEAAPPPAKKTRMTPAAGSTSKGMPGDSLGGGSSTVDEIYMTPQPSAPGHSVTRTWTKVHKLLSFGIANTVIKRPGTGTALYALTTALAEIPVDRLNWYLNPHEFTLLQPGERAVSCKVEVYMRNVRTAFQTAASATETATFNQNKNGLCAVGLNRTGFGMDMIYKTFDATNLMKPATLELANMTGVNARLYGATTLDGSIPSHQIGGYFVLNHYFTLLTDKATQGWPMLTAHVKTFDSADAINKCICCYEYSFGMGLLKQTAKYRFAGFPTPANGDGNTAILAKSTNDAVFAEWEIGQTEMLTNRHNRLFNAEIDATRFTHDQILEKSQVMLSGPSSSTAARIQPSLHVGVEAVPSMTTTDMQTSLAISKWLDTQALYDVKFTLTTEYEVLSRFPLGAGVDVDWNNLALVNTNTGVSTNSTAIDALFREDAITWTNATRVESSRTHTITTTQCPM